MNELLDVSQLKKYFPNNNGFRSGRPIKALDGVTFSMKREETLSIVGESGCGKSTLGRTILRLSEPTSGNVWLDGFPVGGASSRDLRRLRQRMQVVFQDPASSLNPHMRIRGTIAEPITNFKLEKGRTAIDDRVAELLKMVGLPPETMRRYPHEFSGGQRQRIAIARALASNPDLLICDEAVSALDVSVKAQIVNLLNDLKEQLGLANMFISHDLAIVEHMTDRVAVMYLGIIVEIGDRDSVFLQPAHPYTRALLSSVPTIDASKRRERIVLKGEVPSPANIPKGCRFRTRCPLAFGRCAEEEPKLRQIGDTGHFAACHLSEEGAAASA